MTSGFHDPLEDNPFADHADIVAEVASESTSERDVGNRADSMNAADTVKSTQSSHTGGTAPVENVTSKPVSTTSTKTGTDTDTDAKIPSTSAPDSSNNGGKNDDQYYLAIKVTKLERIGSLSNKRENPTIFFTYSTNLPTFHHHHTKGSRNSSLMIRKTTTEFQQLFKYLNTSTPECLVPSLPSPYTNYGINTTEDYKRTVTNYQRWFDRLTASLLLIKNEEVAFFVESDYDTYTPLAKSKGVVTGLKRRTLKQLAPPYDSVTTLAEFRPLVKEIYLQGQVIQERLLRMSRAQRVLVQQENEFGGLFCKVGEDNGGVVSGVESTFHRLYKRYGRVLMAVGDISSIVPTTDLATLYDGLEWIVKDAYTVKETLTNRHFVMRELSQAQQAVKGRQETARKLRSKRDVNPLKVEEAVRNLQAATRAEQQLTLKLQRITDNLLLEREKWLEWYESQLLESLRQFTFKRIEYERKKLAVLERLRTEVRRADSRGGLSRLGRQSLVERSSASPGLSSSPVASQGLEGDSWTGEQRRRTQREVDLITHTEFDCEHAASQTDVTSVGENDNDNSSDIGDARSGATSNSMTSRSTPDIFYGITLDARSAASLLGMTAQPF